MKFDKLAFIALIGAMLLLAGCTTGSDLAGKASAKSGAKSEKVESSCQQDGKTVTVTNKYTQYCDSGNSWVEYSCNGNDVSWSSKKCSKGQTCKEGVCVDSAKDQCKIVDGKVVFIPASGETKTLSNGCKGTNNYVVYSCDTTGTKYIEDVRACPTGQECSKGTCMAPARTCKEIDVGVLAKNEYTNNQETQLTNYCRSKEALIKFYCDTDGIHNYKLVGCSNEDKVCELIDGVGQCVAPTTAKADSCTMIIENGVEVGIMSYTAQIDFSEPSYNRCQGETGREVYFCEGLTRRLKTETCESGAVCTGKGICVKQETATQ